MYLAEVVAENFRIFGSRFPQQSNDDNDTISRQSDDRSLRIRFRKGVNVLVGENDSGKTAIIDTIRFCLWTTSQDYHRFTEDDFHCAPEGRASELVLQCRFLDLSIDDQASFLEWLTVPEGESVSLYVTTKARMVLDGTNRRIAVTTRSGPDGDGPPFEGAARELLRVTYLRPLRDAESELRPGRNSRLSRILASHPNISKQEEDDFDQKTDKASTLVGIVHRADHHIDRNPAITGARDDINSNYLSYFGIGSDQPSSDIGVAGDISLVRILEKLELRLAGSPVEPEWTRRGLGMNNALFMSAELLLLGSEDTSPTLLIEEPEAHLHPQLQARIVDLLKAKASDEEHNRVQVIFTTHSPNLASSIPLDHLTLLAQGQTYSLSRDETLLDDSDYAFLERFLDVTKANLFFAKGVLIVEGDAEALLLPTLAQACGSSLSQLGVSIVNVGHVGLFRYSKVFQRPDERVLPINVACLRDRDVVPDHVSDELRGNLMSESSLGKDGISDHLTKLRSRDGGSVRTFVSDQWTFEYDLACTSWRMATVMHQAIQSAARCLDVWPSSESLQEIQRLAEAEVQHWRESGQTLPMVALQIYAPLKKKGGPSKPVSAQHAAELLKKKLAAMDEGAKSGAASPENLTITEMDIPLYIRDAFAYVAGKSET